MSFSWDGLISPEFCLTGPCYAAKVSRGWWPLRSQLQSWLRYGPDLGVWVGQLSWKMSLYCMYIDMSWKFCVIIQLYLSVPEELNSTSPPALFPCSCFLLWSPMLPWVEKGAKSSILFSGECFARRRGYRNAVVKKKKKATSLHFCTVFTPVGNWRFRSMRYTGKRKTKRKTCFGKTNLAGKLGFCLFLQYSLKK